MILTTYGVGAERMLKRTQPVAPRAEAKVNDIPVSQRTPVLPKAEAKAALERGKAGRFVKRKEQ